MPKLRISGALQYLLWFLGRNERNKCGGNCLNEYTWLKICEKEKWIVQKDQVKRKKNSLEKNGLEQKKEMKRKKERKKRSRSAI